MLFKQLGLSAELLRAIEKQGYTEATPIQRDAIPHILEGRDILASAQTGTGKTAGFTLPLLQRLSPFSKGRRHVRALILVPTREVIVGSVADAGVVGADLLAHGPAQQAEDRRVQTLAQDVP